MPVEWSRDNYLADSKKKSRVWRLIWLAVGIEARIIVCKNRIDYFRKLLLVYKMNFIRKLV